MSSRHRLAALRAPRRGGTSEAPAPGLRRPSALLRLGSAGALGLLVLLLAASPSLARPAKGRRQPAPPPKPPVAVAPVTPEAAPALEPTPEPPAVPAVPAPVAAPEAPAGAELVGSAELRAASPAPAPTDRLRLNASSGFGWVDAGQAGPRRDAFDYGVGLTWLHEDLRVFGNVEHARYRREYLGQGADPAGGPAQSLDLDEDALGARIGLGYDLAGPLDWHWQNLELLPFGALALRQYINDIFPSTLAGVQVGLDLGLELAPRLRAKVGGDYTYNLGRFVFSGEEPLQGVALGLAAGRAALEIDFAPATLAFGYQGRWLTLEHDLLVEHLAQLALSFDLSL